MAKASPTAAIDVAAEQRRIDAAIDGDVSLKAVALRGCNTCGAPPGAPCLNALDTTPRSAPHRGRIADYETNGPATTASDSLATTPDASEVALKGLQQAVRAQILAFCEQDLNAKTLSRLQRFCASMGQAMISGTE